MKSIRVLSVIGSRPEGIKMAPVVLKLRETPGIDSLVCTTSQHREMLDQVLELFDIVPDFDLNLMTPNQTLSSLSAAIFSSMSDVFEKARPDWVLVQGDTTTVAIVSLAAFYNQIRVGHVEAGLRSHDKLLPFPEEVNRKVASVVAELHFAPTELARSNLTREGIDSKSVLVTGNTVIDALHLISKQSPEKPTVELLKKLGCANESGEPANSHLIVVTAHRRENFGEPIINICQAIKEVARKYGDSIKILYPVHLNPNVQKPVYEQLEDIDNVFLTAPMDYLEFVHILKNAFLVLTDSGGIQEEAPGLGIPVLVLRDVTERPEGVDAGTVKLIGTEKQNIIDEISNLLDNDAAYQQMANASNPYGDGLASDRIVNALSGE